MSWKEFCEEMDKPCLQINYSKSEDSEEIKELRIENARLKKLLLLDAAKENQKLKKQIEFLKSKLIEDKRCKLIR